MNDYSFEESQNISDRIILIYEDNEKYILNNLLNKGIEIIPIRFSYDLSNFSEEYIEKTKKLFIYYFNLNNSYKNELLRLKKHFQHYRRFPQIAYIPNKKEFFSIIKMLKELNIKVVYNIKNIEA